VASLALPHTFTLSQKGKIFEKKKVIKLNTCVLIFSRNFDRNISHSKNHSARYHKCKYVFMSSTFYLVKFYSNLNFVDKVSKNTDIKFHDNASCGRSVVLDRHEDANSGCL
jgi:hypothetical protein